MSDVCRHCERPIKLWRITNAGPWDSSWWAHRHDDRARCQPYEAPFDTSTYAEPTPKEEK